MSIEYKKLLDQLRLSVGDSEFGYRMQALFACLLKDMGYEVLKINQQGHPDIEAELNNRLNKFQVKTISHTSRICNVTISPADIEGIKPNSNSETGYFAILDCAEPICWIVTDYERIQNYISLTVSIELIRSISDKELSTTISEAFYETLKKSKDNLARLTYNILRNRATGLT